MQKEVQMKEADAAIIEGTIDESTTVDKAEDTVVQKGEEQPISSPSTADDSSNPINFQSRLEGWINCISKKSASNTPHHPHNDDITSC